MSMSPYEQMLAGRLGVRQMQNRIGRLANRRAVVWDFFNRLRIERLRADHERPAHYANPRRSYYVRTGKNPTRRSSGA